jgi:MFS family permease
MSAAIADPRRYRRIGLLLIVLCFALGAVARGSVDAFSVFVLPIGQSFGVERAAITGIYAIVMLGIGFGGPLVGLLVDRLGPRALVLTGVASLGAGLVLASLAQAVWQFYPSFGLLGGIGCASLGSVVQAALLGRWFDKRLGTALAVSYSANGVGVMIMTPLAQALIGAQDWRFAYLVLGIAMLALFVPLLLLPWKTIEAGHPDVHRPSWPTDPGGAAPDLKAALRTATFWNLSAAFALTSVGIYAITPQVVAYLIERGFAPLAAASAAGFAGLLMPVGMIGFNWFADRGGRRVSVIASYGCSILGAASLLALEGPQDRLLLIAYTILFGISMGSRGPMISTLATLRFRGPHLGRIYGSMTLAMGTGGALGAWLGGAVHDLTHGYTAVMLLALAALALAIVPLFIEAQKVSRR